MADPTVPLLYHIEKIFEEKDKALAAALIAVKEEGRKTEVSAEKRFELLNELRTGVATKEQVESLEKLINALKERIDRNDGIDSGKTISWSKLITGAGLAGTVLGMFYLLST